MNTLPRTQLELLHKLRKGWTVVLHGGRYCIYQRYGDPRKPVNQAVQALIDKGYLINTGFTWKPMLELTELGRTAKVTLPAKAKG